ncbi:7TM chemoreceptor [Oesophagostomum dentatum]|uniref:7TM chemoreceptor n=1 Tax=Oesophagostomum dentatum TaxID=61180 RepID=A0A0B1SMX1_OESDE|nr:7TM chemoreceptor [Oesophagostomum dentatum]
MTDLLYLIVVTIFGTSGICCNMVLLYLIAWQSPPYLTPYRIFLGNTAITQLLFSVVFMVVAPRIISYDLRIVVVYLGPVQYLGPWWSYIMLIVLLHFAINSFVSIMLSMLFRWLCLRSLRFPTEAAVVMCFIGYVVPFTMVAFAPYMATVSDAETNDEYVNYTVPDLHKYTTAVGTEVMQAPMLYVVFQISVFLVPIYCVMYYSRWKIYKLIDKRRSFFQHQTTNCHIRLLVQALTVQSIIPLVSTFPASSMFLLGQSGLISTYTYSYIIIPCLSISSFVDPVVTIHYVIPFRVYLRRTLGMSVDTYTTPGVTPTHERWRGSSVRSTTGGFAKSRSSLF